MKTIKLQKMTADSFFKYGCYINMLNPNGEKFGNEKFEFFRDMASVSLGKFNNASFSVCKINKRPLIVDTMEIHSETGEAILALDGDMILQVAPATEKGDIPLDRIEAFYVTKGTLITLKYGVWHHAPFAFNCEQLNMLVVLPERAYANDCYVYSIPEDQQPRLEDSI